MLSQPVQLNEYQKSIGRHLRKLRRKGKAVRKSWFKKILSLIYG